ncbi:DUF3253 domain-containing protein [Williamsia sp. CHRR-6]|uniref:DUF3253 domain-containing protein n=1 Tax=Williamsia sp. CHRR-6 TaxID=2835871 RepID=UPI001BD9BAAD|nr:DUF3253 domain-containing protein [Williamsia sp. CHRR-6]MBT0565577.1 DUF3253 domain-containing protein [Williamsia sp. CHRR-6]
MSTPEDPQRLREQILALLDARRDGATICPSEVARAIAPAQWRRLMDAVRAVARELVEEGVVEITQRGHVVDPASARGPIRIRRVRRRPET